MKSFLSGKKDLGTLSLAAAAPALAISSSAPLHSLPAPHADRPASPVIDVVKEGGKVVRLIVTCSCGDRMEIECLYPAGL